MYQIQRIDKYTGKWRNSTATKLFAGVKLDRPIADYNKAVEAAKAWRLFIDLVPEKVRIIDLSTQEEITVATPDLNKPLTIPRTTLIEKLQENLDAEKAKREATAAEQVKAREEVVALIARFNDDELYNIFHQYWTIDEETLKTAKKNKTFVTPAVEPSKKESDLEKFVRVLGLATDTEIEVFPSDNLYPLL